jgi:hypothetical protein
MSQEKPKKLVKVKKPSNRMVQSPKKKKAYTPTMKKTPKSFYRVSEPLGKSPTPSSDL